MLKKNKTLKTTLFLDKSVCYFNLLQTDLRKEGLCFPRNDLYVDTLLVSVEAKCRQVK